MALEKKSGENMRPFYGREAELRRLKELENKKTASLVVIKSRLAEELAKRLPEYTAYQFQGLPPTAALSAEQEREDFAQQIGRQFAIPALRGGGRLEHPPLEYCRPNQSRPLSHRPR